MTTKEMINPDMATFRSKTHEAIKQEYDDRQLTHTCPQCPMRYPNSGMLVQHMKEEHYAFVRQTASRIARGPANMPSLSDGEKYKNTIATCPYCKHDCQTRKKLMMHLETAHKDDEEVQDDEPTVKMIRIDGSFVTPGASESHVVQNLIRAIGSTASRNIPNGNSKLDNKATPKLQYKCFWCDASFRKRGKLMDHIDALHKQTKKLNEAMAEKLTQDDSNKPPSARPVANHRISQLDVPKMHAGLNPAGSHRAPHPVESKPVASKLGSCSFTLAGSLTRKTKPSIQEDTPPNLCKFYLGKKDNPLTSKKVTVHERSVSHADSRRFSLPSLFEDTSSSSTYNFPYMLSSNPMTAAMQRNFMMGIRPQLLNATQFYAPRMPAMMMPSSDYLLNHAHPVLDQQTTNHAQQLLARMNAMAQMSPLATGRPKTSSESPLDLTKSFI